MGTQNRRSTTHKASRVQAGIGSGSKSIANVHHDDADGAELNDSEQALDAEEVVLLLLANSPDARARRKQESEEFASRING